VQWQKPDREGGCSGRNPTVREGAVAETDRKGVQWQKRDREEECSGRNPTVRESAVAETRP